MKLVLTNGCFDGIHAGHTEMLRYAKMLGDKLIVFVNSDESVKKLKGPNRPYYSETHRLSAIQSVRYVDHAFLFDGDVIKLIEQYDPDVYVKGGDYSSIDDLRESAYLKQSNTIVKFAPKIGDLSSSKRIEYDQEAQAKELTQTLSDINNKIAERRYLDLLIENIKRNIDPSECILDKLPLEYKTKPLHISCPCSKCRLKFIK